MHKICRLQGANLWPKFQILTVFGALFPHLFPDKREIWHGEADLWGEKNIFGRLTKRDTGMAALRARPASNSI